MELAMVLLLPTNPLQGVFLTTRSSTYLEDLEH